MMTPLNHKHRAVIRAFKPGDVLQVEQQSNDIVILKRMKPPEAQARSLEEDASPVTQSQEILALGKYKVKRHFLKLAPNEAKTREDATFRMIAEIMTKKRK
jgi:hypothetical protein